jgi:hypothetical protein
MSHKVAHGGVAEIELSERATGPRVTLAQVEAAIASEHYFTAYDGAYGATIDFAIEDVPEDLRLLTFCVLRLKNGYTVHGTSACADPANYKKDIGERIARENAVRQIWPLMGYELKTQLFTLSQGAGRPEGASEAQPSEASPAAAAATDLMDVDQLDRFSKLNNQWVV